MENSDNYLKTDKLILEYTKEAFNEGLNYITRHNSKSNQIILVLGILLGFLIGASNSIMNVLLEESCTSFIILIGVFILSIILVFVSFFFALRSLDMRSYLYPGDPKEIYEKLREEKEPKVVESFIHYYIEAFEENQKTIDQRSKDLRWSIKFLKLGSISFFFFILCFLVSKIYFYFQ